MSSSAQPSDYESPQLELPFMTDDERIMLTRALCRYAVEHGEDIAQVYGFASRHALTHVCQFCDQMLGRYLMASIPKEGGQT